MKGVKAKWAVLLVLPFSLLCVLSSIAQEVRYPIPAYEGEELTKVREWEKTWAGKRIDSTNVDQVADFLPEGWVTIMTETAQWRTSDLWFEIAPYEQWIPTKGYIEATKRHAPLAREKGFAGKDNDELVTYETEAGFPFPDPKTGLETVWNIHFQNQGESFIQWTHPERMRVMDLKTTTNRTAQAKVTHMWFAARTERDPKPLIPKEKNKKNIRWAYIREHFHPAVIKGNKMLTIRYNSHDKPDDSWSWLSQFKRIRRYVATQKMDTIDGTDSTYEDNEKYNNKLQYQTYKLLGRKDMLVCRNQDGSEWVHTAPDVAFWAGVKRQRASTYVIEATPKDESHVYSKRVWYVDPEFFLITWAERWDSLGKYWRIRDFKFHAKESPLGERPIAYVGGDSSDLERIHGTSAETETTEMSPDIDPRMYSLRGLRKGAY